MWRICYRLCKGFFHISFNNSVTKNLQQSLGTGMMAVLSTRWRYMFYNKIEKIFELQKYRSEFFGKLQSLLGDRDDIKIVGDRFIFESELFFDSGSSTLQIKGEKQLNQIAKTLKETTDQIPEDINWIIQVEGHTDKRPINTAQYPSNWELSTARANSVLKLLLDLGFAPNRLSAAGYGEFYPISSGENDEAFQQIEESN